MLETIVSTISLIVIVITFYDLAIYVSQECEYKAREISARDIIKMSIEKKNTDKW